MTKPVIGAIAPWFGSGRMVGERVGELLQGCNWVGVPMSGGMSELAHITAPSILVGDLHRHVLNLAMVIADPEKKSLLVEALECLPVHPDTLDGAQEYCKIIESESCTDGDTDVGWAAAYFTTAWMARNGTAGTKDEFKAGMSTRWKGGGGDSVVRFRNATQSIHDWHTIMLRCGFVCEDVFDFIGKVHDVPENGLYLDPPFFKAGVAYKHNIGKLEYEQRLWHGRLRDALDKFDKCRVVLRAYDVPLIRELYSTYGKWHWMTFKGRKQTNATAPECLITNFATPTKVVVDVVRGAGLF